MVTRVSKKRLYNFVHPLWTFYALNYQKACYILTCLFIEMVHDLHWDMEDSIGHMWPSPNPRYVLCPEQCDDAYCEDCVTQAVAVSLLDCLKVQWRSSKCDTAAGMTSTSIHPIYNSYHSVSFGAILFLHRGPTAVLCMDQKPSSRHSCSLQNYFRFGATAERHFWPAFSLMKATMFRSVALDVDTLLYCKVWFVWHERAI